MKKYLLILIVILAFALRFWRLDSYPAFNADEAALGYNAYSLIKTGMDEHGNKWPIHFQSFNDFKPGGYVYLILPFVKLFGLNEWAVRIPSAALGVATIYVLYLLVKILFKDEKNALFAALFLAISPWHIHFSRGGWEVNVAAFLITLGVYMFIKFVNDKNYKTLMWSLLSFAASLYMYHSARLISPIIGLGLVAIYWKELEIIKKMRSYLICFAIFAVVMLPLVLDFTRGSVGSRVAGVGLFADPGPLSRIEEQRTEHGDFRSLPAKVIHNKFVNYGLAFLENWSEHYHGLFLFLSGDDIQRNKVPETGQMYLFDLPLLAIGIWQMIKNFKNKGTQVILFWVIIAPFAAALTFQSPHALRAQNMAIPLVVISSIGLTFIVNEISKIKRKDMVRFGYAALIILVSWSFLRYEHMYWVHMAKEYPFSSQYGVKELVSFIKQDKFNDRQIVITDRYDQPYILYLFYTKYDPKKFQAEHKLTPEDGFGFSTVRDFNNLHFYSIKFEEMRTTYPNSLIIGTPEEIPDESNIIKKIYGTNGYNYFDIVAN